MSSFQFSDEEKPQPATPAIPPTPPPANPNPSAPEPSEDEDDFSFLSQAPAPTAAPTPIQPTPAPTAAPSPPRATPVSDRATPAGQNVPRPQVATPRNATPQAQPAQPKPLQAGTGARTAGAAGAPQARSQATFDPAADSPLIVPNPANAPRPAAAAALTPTPAAPAAEEVVGAEANESVNDFFGLGTGIRRALDMLESPASWALRVFGIVGVLCLAFLLAALFFGGVGTLGATNPKTADIVRNLGFAAKGFGACLLVTAIASLILSYEDNRMGAIFAFIGAALMFGTPLLVKVAAGETAAGALVGPSVIPPLLGAGRALFYIGAAKATIDLFDFLWKLPDRVRAKVANVGQGRPTEAKQRAIASQANMMSPCWQLPFCREAIRVLCPAFIAKKTCWKFGRGCYCDEEMIGRIVRGEPMTVISAPTRISQGKPPCGRCYIYLEHQTYKFRMFSPLALPATILIGFAGYPLYDVIFKTFDKGAQSVWGMFAFKPPVPEALSTSQANIDAVANTALDAAQISGFAQIILGVMLGFFLLIYISKGIEWAIFKAKL